MNLTGDQVAWASYALRDLISRRRLGGHPIRPELIALFHYLDTSADGSESTTAGEQLGSDDLIDAFEAAEIMHRTPRWVTQIHADLDGVKIGRQWVFRRQTVAEYAEWVGCDGDRVPRVGRRAVSTRTPR
jgi:hypothetical protein